MRRVTLFALILVSSSGRAGPSREELIAADQARWASAPTTAAQYAQPPAGWVTAEEASLGISLAFPCKPARDTVNRGVHSIRMLSCSDGGHAYVALLERYPSDIGGHAEEFHAGSDFGAVESLAAKGITAIIKPKARVTSSGAAGRDVRIASPEVTIDKRTLVRKDVTIQLQLSVKATPLNDEAAAFFNGLRFE